MKTLYKVLFTAIAGLFAAGIVSASLGEYWSTISHLIPRTNDAVDIGSTAKRVRALLTNDLTFYDEIKPDNATCSNGQILKRTGADNWDCVVDSAGTDEIDDTMIDWGTGTNQISSADVPDHNGHSVRDTFVHIVNRGVAEAITVTLTGGLGVSWTTGEIYDRANHTFVATDAGSGNVTNNVVNYLKWVSGTALTLSTSDATGDEVLIAIGTIYDGNIDGYRETSLLDESLANIRRCSRAVFPTRVTSGMSVHEDADATNPLDVTMDAGVYCKELQERITPVEIKSRNTAMVRHFHTGGVWDSDTNAQIETTNYDNGTGKTAIPSNKWVKGLFVYMNGKIGFVYPTECFNTTAEAQEGALPLMPTGLEPIPKLTAVVYQQGAVNFTGAIWQDVRAGISEESFSGVTDHGALAGLSDDDHTIYTLAAGTRAFTGTQTFNEDIEMKDDKILYFDTAKSHWMGYSTDHSELYFSGSALAIPGLYEFYSNTGVDGNGNWEPYFALKVDGSAYLENTTQGANKIFKVHMTDGMVLQTTDLNAYIKADNISTSNKTFQFPNFSGTFITSGNLTDITTVGTIAAGTWNGTSIADANVDNNITIDLATLASTVTNATFTTALTVNTGTLTLTADVANNSVLTIGAGASSISGANTGDQDLSGYQTILTNSAGLLAALSDETGTGLSVFSTSPTFTTGITVPADSISHTELSEGDAFVFTGSVALPQGAAPTVDSVGETAIDTTSDQLIYYGSAKRVLQEEDTKCFSLENLAAADDNYEFYMANDAVTITAIGLHCAGTCTTGADISLEDRAGNAMTHTVPTHSTGSGNTTFQAVTNNNTLVAGEGLRFDVDNAVSPETDTYLICFKMKYTSD